MVPGKRHQKMGCGSFLELYQLFFPIVPVLDQYQLGYGHIHEVAQKSLQELTIKGKTIQLGRVQFHIELNDLMFALSTIHSSYKYKIKYALNSSTLQWHIGLC